ncbi:hypothetical protein APHAL10511_008367 [Amanita phalloides]|nr:hypothetical protein APHAL10511_008367 [Amanita phalloides]
MITGPQPLSGDAIAKNLAAFDSIPLFMKSLPSEETDNSALAALQSLAHDGTPDEVAQNFKEQGNDCFKGKRYRDALGFYTQGIDAQSTDPELREALMCNRAACNLELKNYGSVLRDCSKVLGANPRCSKAYYRSTLALLALERLDEALDCCNRCLEYDGKNQSVHDIKGCVEKAKVEKERKEQERREQTQKEKEKERKFKIAFKERHLIVMPNPEGSSNPTKPVFDPEDPSGKTMIFPVFFLYPQYATSDIVSQVVEDTPLGTVLSSMFPPQATPPEWDANPAPQGWEENDTA